MAHAIDTIFKYKIGVVVSYSSFIKTDGTTTRMFGHIIGFVLNSLDEVVLQ